MKPSFLNGRANINERGQPSECVPKFFPSKQTKNIFYVVCIFFVVFIFVDIVVVVEANQAKHESSFGIFSARVCMLESRNFTNQRSSKWFQCP